MIRFGERAEEHGKFKRLFKSKGNNSGLKGKSTIPQHRPNFNDFLLYLFVKF